MSKEKLLKAEYGSDKTPLVLGNIEIPCYVLNDGTRVFSGRGIQRAIGANPNLSGTWLNKYVNNSPIAEFIAPGVLDKFNNPIKFERTNATGSQSTTFGYEVTILIDICDAIIQGNKTRKNIDKNIVNSAETIIRSVAKVGIIALVDEVTGYQYKREKDELQKILKAYISEELLPWQKKFPDVFYKELFRLNGWDYTVNGIKKRPSVVGKWTNTLIYEQLPDGVLKELKNNTPKSGSGNYTARFFQSLTPDVGNPHLTAQIQQMVTLFMLSENMKDMWNKFEKLRARQLGQMELPFEFDKAGHTIEPTEKVYEEKELSSFNKKLKRAIAHKPKPSK